MFNTIGERIIYCRNLLGLARNDMAAEIGDDISLPTLARWELNTVTPSTKKIEILTRYFINRHVNVSVEWIREGAGIPPISINLKKFDAAQFDELTYATLVALRNKIKDFYFAQVNSNFFRPILSFGDYVGGIVEPNIKMLDKKLCFLITDNVSTAGIYDDEKNAIINSSGETLEILSSNKTIKIGKLQWIVRRP